MGENEQKNEVQDPAEPKKVEKVIETHDAKESVSEVAESGQPAEGQSKASDDN